MTKAELVSEIAEKTDLTKSQVNAVLDVLADTITRDVYANGNNLTLPGLGTFKRKESAARVGRNPQTGASLNIPAKTKLGFTASSSLKK